MDHQPDPENEAQLADIIGSEFQFDGDPEREDRAPSISFTQMLAAGLKHAGGLAMLAKAEQDGTLHGGPPRSPEERAEWLRQDRENFEAIKRDHPEVVARLLANVAAQSQ